MELIESFKATSSTSSITFSNIPQTFKKLYLYIRGKSTSGLSVNVMQISTNRSVTTRHIYRYTNGSVQSTQSDTNTGYFYNIYATGSDGRDSNFYGSLVWSINNYALGGQYTTMAGLSSRSYSDAQYMQLSGGIVESTSSIDTLTFQIAGTNWASGSMIALYGV